MINIKKINSHNLFHKWPRIIYWRMIEKIRKSPAKIFLFSKQPKIITDQNGMRFVLYPWMTQGLKKLITKSHYIDEFKAIDKLTQKGDIIFDVGANAGVISVHLSHRAEETGKVYAFEPIRETYYQLKENLALNKCENVQAYNLAMDKEPSIRKMNCFEQQNSEWNTFGYPEFNGVKPSQGIDVQAETIDFFCETREIKKINFLKIDVEGFERDVLTGAQKMLKGGQIDFISFEISQIPIKAAGIAPKEIFDLLRLYDYKAYRFNSEDNSFAGPVEDSDDFCLNFYAAKKDLTQI